MNCRAIVQGHLMTVPGPVVGRNLFMQWHEVNRTRGLCMIAHELVSLRGLRIVVERYTGRDDINKGKPTVHHGRLDQWDQLLLVTGKAAPHETRAHMQRGAAQVDCIPGIRVALLAGRAFVSGGGVLALGQAIAAVVHHYVNHVQVAPGGMHKLPHTNRGRVAIPGDTQVEQLPIGECGPCGHRRHAPVHGVESVRLSEKIGRRLRRTTDPRELGYLVWFDRQLMAGANNCPADGIVAAPGAQGRNRTFVIRLGVAQVVGLERGMPKFGDLITHADSPEPPNAVRRCRGVTLLPFKCFFICLRILRALIGVPSKQSTDFSLSGPSSNSAISRVRNCASRFCSMTKTRSCRSMNAFTSSLKGKARMRIAFMAMSSATR